MKADRMIAVAVIAFTAIYCYGAGQIPLLTFGDPIGPRLFPYLVGGLLILGAIILLFEARPSQQQASGVEAPTSAEPSPGGNAESVNGDRTRQIPLLIAGLFAWTFIYILAFERLGYVISTTIFLFGLTLYFHPRRWLVNSAVSLLLPASVYFAFDRLLKVNLPAGLLSF
jgi:putative tricarboxylic transport membrane protein